MADIVVAKRKQRKKPGEDDPAFSAGWTPEQARAVPREVGELLARLRVHGITCAKPVEYGRKQEVYFTVSLILIPAGKAP